MTVESLKDLLRKTKSEFDEFNSVHEFDGDLFGIFIEGYDKCRPVACEMHGEKTIPRMVSDLNVVRQIERGMDENGLTLKCVQALARRARIWKTPPRPTVPGSYEGIVARSMLS
jgi:hypothetical protein